MWQKLDSKKTIIAVGEMVIDPQVGKYLMVINPQVGKYFQLNIHRADIFMF